MLKDKSTSNAKDTKVKIAGQAEIAKAIGDSQTKHTKMLKKLAK
jgi:hypothetical protein